jgi:hypothetical protein
MSMSRYTGYLRQHVDCIVEMYGRGFSTGEIAQALYANGVRADTTDPNPKYRMTRAHHVKNLRLMVLFVLQRLGLRTRRERIPHYFKPHLAEKHDPV